MSSFAKTAMATPRTILIDPAVRGLFHLNHKEVDANASANAVSEVLQKNHEQSHIFFNNHMMHVRTLETHLGHKS
jgi:hypothetical protein